MIKRFSVIDYHDVVTELFGHFQYMGGEEHAVSFCGMFAHHLLKLLSGLGIKAGHWLIQYPGGRIVHQCGYDHQLLAHAV